eukprot:CAMPEP_0202402660 /NCGR_PEP_ID=MMETSP1128-20130828/4388_1 /ASSEMBLY_ACC=CAM_ASM_000463 /TAXON_ID=3047 /ORGANISM="Dunaliella tertiolecta, Strain CCMP1320" /LENGTH=51 /DNA_ID=CAMNT_0049006733 /DNA_START=20 /DNA_END=171 /DNA_ORIENTATION=-
MIAPQEAPARGVRSVRRPISASWITQPSEYGKKKPPPEKANARLSWRKAST